MTVWTAFGLFAVVYLAVVLATLAWVRSKRPRCGRCGQPWQRTERGGEFHLCTPNRRVVS